MIEIVCLSHGTTIVSGDDGMVTNKDFNSSKTRQLLDQINSLKREDETLYNILAVDVWALAKTMDEFQPGFWTAFMKNREKALKRFMNEANRTKSTESKTHPFLR